MSNRARVLVLVMAGALVGACAGAAPSPTPTSSPALTPVPTAPSSASASPAPSSATPSPAPTSASSSPAPSALALEVVARDLSFTPRALVAPAGGMTRISIRNDGRVVHNLTIDALQLQLIASPGETKTADLVDVPPGTYTFYCSVSGHRQAGMEGTLTVQ